VNNGSSAVGRERGGKVKKDNILFNKLIIILGREQGLNLKRVQLNQRWTGGNTMGGGGEDLGYA